ncbi:MAG: glucose-6-phosphate isomerase [Alphaproteobacteria bacterium]
MPTPPGAPSYEQDIGGAIGSAGLSEDILFTLTAELQPALKDLQTARIDGSAPVLALPDSLEDLEHIENASRRVADGAENVVILGTGGSSLGGQTLVRLADQGFGPRDGHPELHFFDNVDPATFNAFFASANPSTTKIVSISKSGGTAETLLQTLTCLQWLDTSIGPAASAAAFTVLTEPKDSPLARLADERNMARLPHHLGVGGRYSALSNVGLLPAAVAGLDIRAIRDGARSALDASLLAPASKSPAAIGAALNIGLAHAGFGTTVLMPYVDVLAPFAFWFRQLWAESLGKDGHGTLPVNALGTVDQHSQLQLYLAGPNDKLFTLILADRPSTNPAPQLTDDAELAYLNGRPLGDLLDAEQLATAATLIANNRPTRILRISQADEQTLGALMAHYELETILAARLLGVDPYDQPAVEEGKVLARQYLESAGPAP